ncbi:MAG: hypothetical protein NZ992_03645 [Candidatus Korarchaeum sp.]|nr:hypothetical protein [Candidatus Korarchaeum sp.]
MLFALLTVGPLSSVAIDSYSASYLIDLYERSRSDLLSVFGSLGGSEVSSTDNTTNSTTNNTTEEEVVGGNNVTTTTTVSSKCSYAQEEIANIVEVADSYIEQAKSLLSSGSYKEAAKLALKALNTLGRAWILVGQCFSSRVVEVNANVTANITNNTATANATVNNTINATVNASRVAPGLLVAVLRHEIRLARLNAVITKAENLSLNVSVAKNLSAQVAQLLEEARAQALAGNVDAAAQLIAKANNLMAQIVRSLKTSSSKAIKVGKLEEVKVRMKNETAKLELIPPGLEKREAWKGDKGKPEAHPGKGKKGDKSKPEPPGKGKKN